MTIRNIGGSLEPVAHELAKRLLGHHRYPIRELRNKVALGHTIPALRRFEDAEVKRLAAQVTLPRARVAVVTATYRRPELLQSAVRSALNQTITDMVMIVVDDGGGLPKLADDPRLQACSLSKNTGVLGLVLNTGIRLTHSDYVAFLDDDNEWEPNHLEVAIAALESGPVNARPGLVYTALRRSLPNGQVMDILSTPFDRRLLARESFVDTNSLVIKRSSRLHFSRLRRPIGVRPREDWELVYRLSRRIRTLHVPVPTVRYRVNPRSYYTDWTKTLGEDRPTEEISAAANHENL
jgi:glycosyltransferase involved in cell wall biosynthesis